MPLQIDQIITLVQGQVFGKSSSCEDLLKDAMPLQDARCGDLTLVDSVHHLNQWKESLANVALAPNDIAAQLAEVAGKTVIGVTNLHQAFETAIVALRKEKITAKSWEGIHPTAVIHPTAQVALSASVGPHVTIGAYSKIGDRVRIHGTVQIMEHCVIEEDCEIFPSAVLYPGTILHQRVLLHASTILGAYGFGYRQCDGQHVRTAQLGWVEVEADAEVGAGTTIDRGTYGPTRIGRGSKLDNQIQIGHNVHVGQHNLLCAQVGIAGSSSTGNYVVLGGQVGVRDHIHLADRVMAAAQSGIANDVESGHSVLGTPALPQREATQIWIHSQRLPEIRKQIKALEAQVKELQKIVFASTSIGIHTPDSASTITPSTTSSDRAAA